MSESTFSDFPTVEESKHRIPMSQWKCRTPDNYSYIGQVGEGTFGKVFKAIYTDPKKS